MAPFFVQNFLSYLQKEKRYSEHTCLAYQVDIEQFLNFSLITKKEDLIEVSSLVIRGWMVDLIDNSYSNRSVNRKMSSLRSFF